MKTALDLRDQTYGRLTAVEPTEMRRGDARHRSVVWRCRCSCGGEALVTAHCLVHGFTQSCGCIGVGRKREKLEGRRFGRLKVNRYAGKVAGKYITYEVTCDCGTTRTVHASSLRKGMRSCGCERRT